MNMATGNTTPSMIAKSCSAPDTVTPTKAGIELCMTLAVWLRFVARASASACASSQREKSAAVFEEKGEGKKRRVAARLQELGPRFTLRLKSLQMGTFDTQHGEYEWKRQAELDRHSRRRFHL
jgi:hypothetical protein